MRKLILLLVLFASCSTSKDLANSTYYECTGKYGYHLYATSECKGETVAFIPYNIAVYTKTPKKRENVFVSYGSKHGYARNPKFKEKRNTGFKIIPSQIVTMQDSMLAIYNSQVNYSSPSYYTPSSGAKTIQVKGYTRKDGTYVRPHTRSAPRGKN